MRIVADILIIGSIIFAFAGVMGILRMPDTFCRMQSSTNISTFGVLGVILGGIIYCAFILKNGEMAIKLAVLGAFYLITTPISGHAIAKGAYWHGIRPKKEMKCDQLKEDLEDD
ncbi:MAG: monovalent cation/H(+) antiporter subunit G [Clostridia bacterium]|nr:monovalent cation/H(+) antiporter subunit G [Clostridia bacterium]